MTVRVLVTDGEQRAALAVVRSLGRAGYACTVVASRARSLAGASRYCHRSFQVPEPLADPVGFRDAVAGLVSDGSVDLVLPIADPSLLALLAEPERLVPAVLPFPDLATVRAVADKERVSRAALECGIAVPGQVLAADRSEALALAGQAVGYPLVVKPVRSVAGSGGRRVKVGVRLVERPSGLAGALADLPEEAFPVLLQERIYGPGVGLFLLLWDGQVRAVFAHRRLREKPPAGGVSVYRESIPADPELVRVSVNLLHRLNWQGVAMVEYKVDQRTGRPCLMEINGRFWGSLQLAIDAGVDFPRLLADLALGHAPQAVPGYRAGVRSRWLFGDLDHLLARLRHTRAELALPPDAPGVGRVMAQVLIPWRPGDRHEVLRLSDPGPFLLEALDWFGGR